VVVKPASVIDDSTPYVLIIDEINRGNIAKIFGELITLIEPSKRAGADESLSVRLPYSKDEFSVPSNLYLIGTMNTADRSLAQIDIALRRRFNFEELMPDLDVLKDVPSVSGIDVSKMLEAINMRIELLYDREHTIGHSHFLPLLDDPTLDCLAEIFEYQILPLLEEYFFEDWDLIAQVLGDNFKPSDSKFIKPKYRSQKIVQLMGEDWADQNQQQVYVRNPDALISADAYIGIYQSIADDAVL
jgi:5-methylcytosine-specific restriction protein B